MPRSERPWKFTPHSPIRELTENLWLVDSQVPRVPVGRRMGIVRRSTGELDFVPCHGDVISLDAPSVLRRVAAAA